jgi:putative ABC transport system permease protein
MIKQMFKLVWHRKKRNFLLMSEIFFSFMVLFAVGAMVISSTAKYLKPLGFSYENVWVVDLGWYGVSNERSDFELRQTLRQLELEMRSHEEIEHVAFGSGSLPYGRAQWRTNLNHEGQEVVVDYSLVSDDYAKVFDIPVVEGRWFGREDDGSARTPIVLDGTVKKRLFGDGPAVGHVFTKKKNEYVVVGVVGNFRYRGEFADHPGGFFERYVASDPEAMAGQNENGLLPKPLTSELPRVAVLAVREGTGVGSEEQLFKRLSSIARGWVLRIETLEDLHASYIGEKLLELVTMGTVAGFLVFNVALGLFGVLWYSISRRRGEIGLRRALGANSGHVSGQILGETLALATFGIIAGIFVAAQVPVLGLEESVGGPMYVLAMVASAVMIYLIVSVCALYPSRLAARIQPAEALHDE